VNIDGMMESEYIDLKAKFKPEDLINLKLDIPEDEQ